jgi:hypothetical protein
VGYSPKYFFEWVFEFNFLSVIFNRVSTKVENCKKTWSKLKLNFRGGFMNAISDLKSWMNWIKILEGDLLMPKAKNPTPIFTAG